MYERKWKIPAVRESSFLIYIFQTAGAYDTN